MLAAQRHIRRTIIAIATSPSDIKITHVRVLSTSLTPLTRSTGIMSLLSYVKPKTLPRLSCTASMMVAVITTKLQRMKIRNGNSENHENQNQDERRRRPLKFVTRAKDSTEAGQREFSTLKLSRAT